MIFARLTIQGFKACGLFPSEKEASEKLIRCAANPAVQGRVKSADSAC